MTKIMMKPTLFNAQIFIDKIIMEPFQKYVILNRKNHNQIENIA